MEKKTEKNLYCCSNVGAFMVSVFFVNQNTVEREAAGDTAVYEKRDRYGKDLL